MAIRVLYWTSKEKWRLFVPKSVVCVGEVMLELSGVQPDGSARFGFGGDTANTAIYLSRLFGDGAEVGYLTRLGQGAFSDDLADALAKEHLVLSPTAQTEAGTPGLYAISTDDVGERSFTYWRSQAAVRQLLSGDLAEQEVGFMSGFDVLYLSGITLAVLQNVGRKRLLNVIEKFGAEGKQVMFDVNYRAHLWQSHSPDVDVAQLMEQVISASTIVKIGQDEALAIFGTQSVGQTIDRLSGLGNAALVITDGAGRIVVQEDGTTQDVEFEVVAKVVDATAAGDSFSAGLLAARLDGADFQASAKSGQRLAARVIQFPGAIIPIAKMPALDR